MNTKKTLLGSALVLYFVIAFEVLIMISPFAGFFYYVFNPVLLKLSAHLSTRWLSAFFLPHMILPKDWFLQFVRVMGSVLFVLGMTIFIVCAGQIYTAKFRKRGAVLGGLYSFIRHPQYLALCIAGLGLSILWPRFLTLALWIVMALVYYFLAKDEERRMLNAHEQTYRTYMSKTGMFLPRNMEKALTPSSPIAKVLFALVIAGVVLGSAFLLRLYTISQLTLWTKAENVTVVAILPEDGFKMAHRMNDILALKDVMGRMDNAKKYLVYFIPRDYIMQGMIADTGGDWKLFEQHRTIGMIADWVFNPFGHLRGEHHAMHGMVHHDESVVPGGGVIRRLIFISLEDVEVKTPSDCFSINALRVPQFMVDVDVHNLRLLDIKELPHGSGWGTVPTPMF
ncbi:MAG TPA: isoprenylcysteine carboxylmethyltransferase family protein [Nitrospirota bacterium]|nr:isoprenylcysteine carboxylmethyltransferase family protein [Nitrospirota bacterium]